MRSLGGWATIVLACSLLAGCGGAAATDHPKPYADLSSSPDDIYKVLPTPGGFLAVSDCDIYRGVFVDGRPRIVAEYSSKDGLPGVCWWRILVDAAGGAWARRGGTIVHLPQGDTRCRTFAPGGDQKYFRVTDMVLSPAKDRIWVATTDGLATTRTDAFAWQQFPMKGVTRIYPDPAGDGAWCRRESRAPDKDYGADSILLRFDLGSGTWTELPGTLVRGDEEASYWADRDDLAPNYHLLGNRLYVWARSDGWPSNLAPPRIYDLAAGKVCWWAPKGWKAREGFEDSSPGEGFGQMLPSPDGSGRMWLATSKGLWLYDPGTDGWKQYSWIDVPCYTSAYAAITRRGDRIYWASQERLAAFEVATGKWTVLRKVKPYEDLDVRGGLQLSPDETHLWWRSWVRTKGNVSVTFDLRTHELRTLAAGLAPDVRVIRPPRFFPEAGVALIPTDMGIVAANYDGLVRSVLRRTDCTIDGNVRGFAFPKGGREVWCQLGYGHYVSSGGMPVSGDRAAIFRPQEGRWLSVPDSGARGWLSGAVFSADGKTTWACLAPKEGWAGGVMVRTAPDDSWKPLAARMPLPCGNFRGLWLAPNEKELWIIEYGRGLLRVKLNGGEVTRYAPDWRKRPCGDSASEAEELNLAHDEVQAFAFAPDGKTAVCYTGGWPFPDPEHDGLNIIDMVTGRPQIVRGMPEQIVKIVITADSKTAWCLFKEKCLWAMDLTTRKWTQKLALPWPQRTLDERQLVVTADGRFVWVADEMGVAVHIGDGKLWSMYDENWNGAHPRLVLSSDGRWLAVRRDHGLEIFSADGTFHKRLEDPSFKGWGASCITATPNPGEFAFATDGYEDCGIYVFDSRRWSLRKVASPLEKVIAMGVDAGGRIWAAVQRGLICIDPATGAELKFVRQTAE